MTAIFFRPWLEIPMTPWTFRGQVDNNEPVVPELQEYK